jgi:hypothetical protein
MRTRTVVVVALAVLALAGCGSSDEPQTVGEFLGWGDDGEEARLAAEQREKEALVAACMAREGFTYIPVEYPQNEPAPVSPEDDLSPEEFARRHGYGMTRWIDDPEPRPGPAEGTDWVDPNQAIVDAMSEPERQAYHLALYGIPPVVDGPGIPIDSTPMPMSGCQGEAHIAVFGDRERIWMEIANEFDALQQRIESDPRIAEAEAEWAACMRGAGYDFATKHEAFTYLDQKLQEEVFTGMPDAPEDDDGGHVQGPHYDQAALTAFRAEEIAIATADHGCEVEAKIQQVRERVTAEHESRFIASHRDQLEQLRGDVR